jgi:hypothetical protein
MERNSKTSAESLVVSSIPLHTFFLSHSPSTSHIHQANKFKKLTHRSHNGTETSLRIPRSSRREVQCRSQPLHIGMQSQDLLPKQLLTRPQLNVTKLDVLDTFPTIKIATAYIHPDTNEKLESFPADLDVLGRVKVEYKEMKGWEKVTLIPSPQAGACETVLLTVVDNHRNDDLLRTARSSAEIHRVHRRIRWHPR